MNIVLTKELKRLKAEDQDYFNELKESDETTKELLISDLSDMGVNVNTGKYSELKGLLYDIFVYLCINGTDPFKSAINNDRVKSGVNDLNVELFALIGSLTEDFVSFSDYEEEIYIVCDYISKKFFNKSYEGLLVDYIEQNNQWKPIKPAINIERNFNARLQRKRFISW